MNKVILNIIVGVIIYVGFRIFADIVNTVGVIFLLGWVASSMSQLFTFLIMED